MVLTKLYNSSLYYGEKLGINSEKYVKYIIAYFDSLISNLNNDNIYIYLIIFFVYFSISLYNIHSITNGSDSIKTHITSSKNLNIENILYDLLTNEDTSVTGSIWYIITREQTWKIKFILFSYIFIVIKRYLYSKFFSVGISIIIFFLLSTVLATANTKQIYIKITKKDDGRTEQDDFDKLDNANTILFITYFFTFIFMVTSYGDLPDTFYISYILLCLVWYSIKSLRARDNLIYVIKHYSFLFFMYIIIYGLITNINNKNTRTINTMNIIIVCSMLAIYVTTINFTDKLLIADTFGIDTNYESVNYLYGNNGDVIDNDCEIFNSNNSNLCI